jgi:hypothetical protein
LVSRFAASGRCAAVIGSWAMTMVLTNDGAKRLTNDSAKRLTNNGTISKFAVKLRE